LRREGAANLLDSLNVFPITLVTRQAAGDQMNAVPPLRQPGALLEQHPFGASDHGGGGDIGNEKYVQPRRRKGFVDRWDGKGNGQNPQWSSVFICLAFAA
jgi:hypothetical protein